MVRREDVLPLFEELEDNKGKGVRSRFYVSSNRFRFRT